MRRHGLFDALQLAVRERRPDLVQLDGQAVFVGNREIDANLLFNTDHFDGKAAFIEKALEQLAGLSAGGGDRPRFRAKGVGTADALNPPPPAPTTPLTNYTTP